MKKIKIYVLILTFFFPFDLYPQEHRDYNWQLGNKSDHSFSEGIEMRFTTEGLLIDTFFRSLGFEYFNASISNTVGNLILYSNGCQIRDGNHQFIPGTNQLNPGPTDIEWCSYGYPVADGGFFIPFFGDSIVMLLHQREEVVEPPVQVINDTLFYTSVRKENNQYVLNEKSIRIVGDMLTDGNVKGVKATKPGAWWVLQGEKGTNKYNTILLDSAKVNTIYSQFMGDSTIDGAAAGQASFSPDGTKYAKYAPRDDLFLFDFDRTTGTLSNFRRIHVADSGLIGGLSFSPNSRFLYVSAQVDLYQFDTWAEDIQDSKIHIGHYDGHLDPFPTTFYHMQLGPDCRIYMNSNNGGYSWHVIHEPDQKGLDCQFEQHGIQFPVSTSITMPNFPNYRLDIGPVCNPNFINAVGEISMDDLPLYPNPTNGPLWIMLPDATNLKSNAFIEILDITGSVRIKKQINGSELFTVGLEELDNGIYLVLFKSTDRLYSRRVVKM